MRRWLYLVTLLALLAPGLFGQVVDTFRAGDVFDMRMSGMSIEDAQPFAQQYTVGPDGTVNIPLIGEIKAIGLTGRELERTMQARFVAGKIFTQPTVIINPVQGLRMVTVTGGVKIPGRLPWTADLTLSSAVGQCVPDDFSDLRKVRIVRGSKILGVFNLLQIDKDPAKDQKLLPGDQVIVPQ